MMFLLECFTCIVTLGVAIVCFYLFALAVSSRIRSVEHTAFTGIRFTCVVPAHNEASHIATTLYSLASVDYPYQWRRIVVVADNCTDATAEIARKHGAQVLVRTNDTLRGKGYALEYAYASLLNDGFTQAVVVIDADTVVSPNLFKEFARLMHRGERVMQAEYSVRNPNDSWRTRLMAVALSMFHRLRHLAREAWGVSVGLRGNGMCFVASILKEYPHQAYGLVEDLEYAIDLAQCGVRVAYAQNATVFGEMVTTSAAAASQRHRWEAGRFALVKQWLPTLCKQAWRKRSLLLLDMCLDLLTPPLAWVAVLLGATGMLHAFLCNHFLMLTPGAILWLIAFLCFATYLIRGLWLCELKWRGVWALSMAPLYIFWKILLMLQQKIFPTFQQHWIRTSREPLEQQRKQKP